MDKWWVKLRNLKLLITGHLNQKWMDCFVKRFLVPLKTGNVIVGGTGAITIPSGTDGQRPTAAQGMLRYNTTSSGFEGYSGSAWGSIGGSP